MSVTFSYPTVAPTHTATLRDPELNDVMSQDIKTTFKRSLSGAMHSFKKTPASITLLLTFSSILKTNMDDLISLFKAAAGGQIAYVDHNSDTWHGYILNNPLETSVVRDIYMDEGSSSSCVEEYDFTITFEGVKQ